MCKICISVIILYLSLNHAHHHHIADVEIREPDNHFDVIVLAQIWPVTTCKYWKHDLNGSECVYPDLKNRWTVHGIWPRTVEGKYLDYCNNSWAFDPEQIKSIEDDLNQAWINTYKETERYSFWKHEWVKHGTCATVLKPLNSQFKYFSKGIEWNQKYSLLDMLDAANLFPSDTKKFTPEEFTNAVKAKTKKNAMIGCYLIDDVLYLHELRICFDTQFNLIDCYPLGKTSCSKGIIFPANA